MKEGRGKERSETLSQHMQLKPGPYFYKYECISNFQQCDVKNCLAFAFAGSMNRAIGYKYKVDIKDYENKVVIIGYKYKDHIIGYKSTNFTYLRFKYSF